MLPISKAGLRKCSLSSLHHVAEVSIAKGTHLFTLDRIEAYRKRKSVWMRSGRGKTKFPQWVFRLLFARFACLWCAIKSSMKSYEKVFVFARISAAANSGLLA